MFHAALAVGNICTLIIGVSFRQCYYSTLQSLFTALYGHIRLCSDERFSVLIRRLVHHPSESTRKLTAVVVADNSCNFKYTFVGVFQKRGGLLHFTVRYVAVNRVAVDTLKTDLERS